MRRVAAEKVDISFGDPSTSSLGLPWKFIPSKVIVLTGLSIVSSGDHAGAHEQVFSRWQVDPTVTNADQRTLMISGNLVVGNAAQVKLGNFVAAGVNNIAPRPHAYVVIL